VSLLNPLRNILAAAQECLIERGECNGGQPLAAASDFVEFWRFDAFGRCAIVMKQIRVRVTNRAPNLIDLDGLPGDRGVISRVLRQRQFADARTDCAHRQAFRFLVECGDVNEEPVARDQSYWPSLGTQRDWDADCPRHRPRCYWAQTLVAFRQCWGRKLPRQNPPRW
jgi:hypothetical protein